MVHGAPPVCRPCENAYVDEQFPAYAAVCAPCNCNQSSIGFFVCWLLISLLTFHHCQQRQQRRGWTAVERGRLCGFSCCCCWVIILGGDVATINVGQLMTSHVALSPTFIGSPKKRETTHDDDGGNSAFQITFRYCQRGRTGRGGGRPVSAGPPHVVNAIFISICQKRTSAQLRFNTLCYSITLKENAETTATLAPFLFPHMKSHWKRMRNVFNFIFKVELSFFSPSLTLSISCTRMP